MIADALSTDSTRKESGVQTHQCLIVFARWAAATNAHGDRRLCLGLLPRLPVRASAPTWYFTGGMECARASHPGASPLHISLKLSAALSLRLTLITLAAHRTSEPCTDKPPTSILTNTLKPCPSPGQCCISSQSSCSHVHNLSNTQSGPTAVGP